MVSDREIAGVLLMELARHTIDYFCLSFAYDYDSELIEKIAHKVGLEKVSGIKFLRRLQRICRRLQNGGVLAGRVSSCQAEYLGEPKVLKKYQFAEPGYSCRLAPDLFPHYKPMGKVETELNLFLDRCFPS